MKDSDSNHSARTAEYFFLTVSILLVIVYLYGEADRVFISAFSTWITPFEAFAAFLMAAFLVVRARMTSRSWLSAVWTWYALGVFLWFLAEVLWVIYTLVLGVEVPYPSIADGLWLAGYVPFLVALLLQVWPFRQGFSSRKVLGAFVLVLVLGVIVLALLIPPVIQEQHDALTLLVSFAYPLLDIALLSVAVPVFLLFFEGTFWRPFMFVMIGIILQLIGDLAFSQTYLIGTYYPGNLQDMLFDWSYLSFTLGFYLALKQLRNPITA